jgi:putative intracellular protease/amidase
VLSGLVVTSGLVVGARLALILEVSNVRPSWVVRIGESSFKDFTGVEVDPDLASKSSHKVINESFLNHPLSNKYDLIILSGGTNMTLLKNLPKLRKEITMIKRTSKPIIGICLGFQLIAFAFGSKLKKREEKS